MSSLRIPIPPSGLAPRQAIETTRRRNALRPSSLSKSYPNNVPHDRERSRRLSRHVGFDAGSSSMPKALLPTILPLKGLRHASIDGTRQYNPNPLRGCTPQPDLADKVRDVLPRRVLG